MRVINSNDYQQDKVKFEDIEIESKEKSLESLSFNVGTSIHMNKLYKGFNWERRKPSPL